MNTSSSSAGDVVNDNSVNLQNGGTVVQMGLARSSGRGSGGQDAYNQGGNSSAASTEYSYNVLDQGAIEKAFSFGEDTLKTFEKSTSGLFDSADNVIDTAENINKDSLEFGVKAINSIDQNANSMMNFADKQVRSLASNNAGVVSMFKNFAENLKAGATSEQTGQEKTMLYIMMALFVVVLIVLIRGRK
ncbi:hypothetical protein P8629_07020 [Hydrogenovibrio sp. 3SP14C1]|uniref:hypothetical protein n=1 Tax=Hydrogenovibrio sp. 3SP14C1 TaxID=3038774 RepID=UPI002416F510|nr:hypothetical protein [Hydrogenovibrio sp. 3SP14C1]MDG4812757.1 hypothetical protein [Hydrogenovibrio sp. 3SP14C1]